MKAPLIQTFDANTVGRDFLVGNVHGHITRLLQAVDAAGFDPAIDRLFSVGDLVDRGPESAMVLDLLDKPWFHAIRGNHEQMLLDYHAGRYDVTLYAWNGGPWAIGMTRAERQPYADAFEALPLAIELRTRAGLLALVHAGCPASDWEELAAVLRDPGSVSTLHLDALRDSLLWDRSRITQADTSPVRGVLAVCVGHTPVPEVCRLGNHLLLDTGAWVSGNELAPFVLVEVPGVSS